MSKTYQLIVKAILLVVIILPFYVNTGCEIPDSDNDSIVDRYDTVWNGDYTIEEQKDLLLLSGYAAVTGYLDIRSDNLTSLNILESLIFVGGGLQIDNNDALTSLNGLENITTVGSGLLIANNAALTSLSGLGNLTSVGYYLWIEDNDCLSAETVNDFYEQLLNYGFEGSVIIENNGSLYPCQ